MLDLKNKSACIFGLPDSGKSTLAHYIVASFGTRAFVFDTLDEYPDTPFDSYVPRDRRSIAEFETVTRRIMASRRYLLYLIDEANRYCPSKPAPLPLAVADLNDYRAHYEIATLYVSRRPVQLNQDLTDLSNYLFIFRLTGKHDIDYLNDLTRGLGDAVSQLAPYHFYLVHPDRTFALMKPVDKKYKTAKKIKEKYHQTDYVQEAKSALD